MLAKRELTSFEICWALFKYYRELKARYEKIYGFKTHSQEMSRDLGRHIEDSQIDRTYGVRSIKDEARQNYAELLLRASRRSHPEYTPRIKTSRVDEVTGKTLVYQVEKPSGVRKDIPRIEKLYTYRSLLSIKGKELFDLWVYMAGARIGTDALGKLDASQLHQLEKDVEKLYNKEQLK